MDDGPASNPKSASELVGAPGTAGPGSELRLEGLILFDSAGNEPEPIEAVVFADEGIGVVRTPGTPPRMLPWSAVSAHVVERWAGGIVPAWWVTPQPRPNGADPSIGSGPPSADPVPPGPGHRLPRADPGAVIAIRTPFGTYRFLRPGADPVELSNRITDFAVRHQGLAGVPSVTVVARPRRGGERRQGSRSPVVESRWSRTRPILVVALVVFLVAAVTLILLQSAGVVHLPYLGGAGPDGMGVIPRTGGLGFTTR